MARAKRYWLLKTEPESYSIDDLRRDKTTFWNGVRNYQARNLLRDEIRKGDEALIYHSSTEPIGVTGLARVVRSGYPDFTAWDPQSPYFDPKSTEAQPVWWMVDIAFVEKFAQVVPLATLKAQPGLSEMMVCKRGSRLSVQPVTEEEFRIVCGLGKGS